jgi:hypothetical protein
MSSGLFANEVSTRGAPSGARRPGGAEPALIRGSLFQSLPSFVKGHLGERRWEEFLGRVDPVAADAYRNEMEALKWYPFIVVASATDALVAMSTEGTRDATLKKFAAHNLDRATNLIFRAIFKIGSPEFMIGKSDQVWKKYYSTGRMAVHHVAKHEASVRLYEFPEITRNYTRAVLYAIEATIIKAGGRTARCEVTHDLCAGDEFTEFSYAWTI